MPVEGLPGEVNGLYFEIRKAIAASAYTAAVLTARKLVMHMAVDKGAAENLPFVKYVEYLAEEGYVPPGAQRGLDYIRKRANEENHEIRMAVHADAQVLLHLAEHFLRNIYEFEALIPELADGPPTP